MKKLSFSHDLVVAPAVFWKSFFDHAFVTKMHMEGLHFAEYEMLSFEETDQHIRRRVRAQPNMKLSGPVAKALGPGLRYEEVSTFDKGSQTYNFDVIPSTMSDKIKTTGVVRTEPAATGCKRIVDVTLEVKIFGVGGLIEGVLEQNVRDSWGDAARYMNQVLP